MFAGKDCYFYYFELVVLKMNKFKRLRLSSLFCCAVFALGVFSYIPMSDADESRWLAFKKHFSFLQTKDDKKKLSFRDENRIKLDFSELVGEAYNLRLKLTMKRFMDIIQNRNEKILYQELEKKIVGASAVNAKSIFEPELTISVERESIRELNSKEESIAR
jgi:hypothetical protein